MIVETIVDEYFFIMIILYILYLTLCTISFIRQKPNIVISILISNMEDVNIKNKPAIT